MKPIDRFKLSSSEDGFGQFQNFAEIVIPPNQAADFYCTSQMLLRKWKILYSLSAIHVPTDLSN